MPRAVWRGGRKTGCATTSGRRTMSGRGAKCTTWPSACAASTSRCGGGGGGEEERATRERGWRRGESDGRGRARSSRASAAPPSSHPFALYVSQVGQFFAARSEFVPPGICAELQKLHDRVPPMPAAKARAVIEDGLGGAPLGDVFQWIDLESPLGSASVAQVHKARLRGAASRRTVVGGLARCRLSPVRRWMR